MLTATNIREIPISRMIDRMPEAPHAIYVEAMRRQTYLLDVAYRQATPKRRHKIISDVDALVLVIRHFYRNHEGGTGRQGNAAP